MDHNQYHQRQSGFHPQQYANPSEQTRGYPAQPTGNPSLYPWILNQHLPAPENFPSASGPLIFEGYIPYHAASQPSVSSYNVYPQPVLSQPSHNTLSCQTHSSARVISTQPETPESNLDDGDISMDDIPCQENNVSANEINPGTRSQDIRPRRGHASRKTGFRGRGGWSKGMKLGPRPAIEPSGEFNRLHQQATNAFIDEHDSEKAKILITKAIAINPEVFSAHALLSEIYFTDNDSKSAIDILFVGAHASPRDAVAWQQVADACLQRSTYDRQTSLEQALYAFNRLVQNDTDDHDSRFQRAAIQKELGKHHKALNELHIILHWMPHNSSVLKLFAEVCIENGELDKALAVFKEAIQHYSRVGLDGDDTFSWSDVNVYIDLVSRKADIPTAIVVLKKLSRWLLGRESETYWDNEENDCEWDAEDEPRRVEKEQYQPQKFDHDCYGLGLPLELRTKLGILRLKQGGFRDESFAHFEWLEPDDTSEQANVHQYPDLFLNVALALNEAKEHEHALRFFEPLSHIDVFNDIAFWLGIGRSSYVCGKKEQAFECFENALKHDDENVEAKTQLSKLYAEFGEKQKAIQYAREAVSTAQESVPKTDRRKYEKKGQRLAREAAERALRQAAKLGPRPPRRRQPRQPTRTKAPSITARPVLVQDKPRASKSVRSKRTAEQTATDRREKILQFYTTLVNNTELMRTGEEAARNIWMDCAKEMLEDFRSNRRFYPQDRYIPFKGYSSESKRQHMNPEEPGGFNPNAPLPFVKSTVQVAYQDILFSDWLEIFLEYATLLAGCSSPNARQDCYTAINATLDCAVWYHDPDSTLQIYICYLTCALALSDESTLFNTVLRWFMRQFQFCTDAYRLFAAINLLFRYPNDKAGKDGQMNHAVFRSGPYQKFLWRHVMSMDRHLPDDYNVNGEGPVPDFMRKDRDELLKTLVEDDSGKKVMLRADELDVVLLTIYGHVLYATGSFLSALSYFYRAHTLDPKNPVVLLSMALSYMHQMLKRQNENRHMYLLQGWAFFQGYADSRIEWAQTKSEETIRQVELEVQFNKSRCWQMLGMSDLAMRGYEKTLANQAEFSMEAAYSMQTMYAVNGDLATAKHITEMYLVVK